MLPYQLIQKVEDLDGTTMYVLPPCPSGNPYEMIIAHDWVAHPELWDSSQHNGIPNLVPDGKALLERNFRDNRKQGFKHDWKELWGREAGKTCIMVSCGPSLNESLDEIRELRCKPGYFTMGVNRAIKATPLDYYVALDRRASSDSSGISDWITEDPRNTTLIAATTVCSDIPQRFRNRYWAETKVTDRVSRCTRINTHLLITLCDAMHAAYKLGATEILLYGCDFAISGQKGDKAGKKRWEIDNYYYDVDAAHGLSIRLPSLQKPLPVMGIGKRLVFVNWELVCNAAYTTAMAYMLEGGGVRVRNRTPRGILWEAWNGDHVPDALPVRSTSDAQSG